MATIEEALAIAIEHHRAGDLQQAEGIYRQILEAAPECPEALHLLGVAAYQRGCYEAAVGYLQRAIRADGGQASFHHALGLACGQLGRLAEATEAFARAVALKPDYAEAYNNLGVAHKKQGRLEEAVACHRRALELAPGYGSACYNLAVALREQGKLDEAIAWHQRAVQLQPSDAVAYNGLGVALAEQGRRDEAISCYQRALAWKPDDAVACNNLGAAYRDQGQLDEAIACFRRAVESKPDFADGYASLGLALQEQGKLDEAVACCRRALELCPGHADAWNHLGLALQEQGKLGEAIACFDRAVEAKPRHANAHWNRSLVQLLQGDFQRGWSEYEWRWQMRRSPPRPFSQPLWEGGPLQGRTILLHAEQGLGDTIQFIRYAELVKQQGGTVVVESQRPLVSLLASCRGADRLIARGDPLPSFDVHCPLLSLPRVFSTSLETIPRGGPYLFADPGLVESWREKLRECDRESGATLLSPHRGEFESAPSPTFLSPCGRGAGGGGEVFRVGIVWKGDSSYLRDRVRSIPLAEFAPLAEVPGIRLVSLQKGPGSEQLAAVKFPVTELTSFDEQSGAFMDTAAILMNLDLLVSADTATAHLAGALGVPVWIALAFVPDWRWLLDRDDSPWYPTVRLFRQTAPGDWAGVFQRMKAALADAKAAKM
jgi:tetratricopeptide (TPR) repeat protein